MLLVSKCGKWGLLSTDAIISGVYLQWYRNIGLSVLALGGCIVCGGFPLPAWSYFFVNRRSDVKARGHWLQNCRL